jgi:hypothetical protein
LQRIESMNGHRRRLTRTSIFFGVVALIAGHGTILLYAWSHTAMSAAVVSGVIILVAIKHLGLLGALSALSRRRSRQGAERRS